MLFSMIPICAYKHKCRNWFTVKLALGSPNFIVVYNRHRREPQIVLSINKWLLHTVSNSIEIAQMVNIFLVVMDSISFCGVTFKAGLSVCEPVYNSHVSIKGTACVSFGCLHDGLYYSLISCDWIIWYTFKASLIPT